MVLVLFNAGVMVVVVAMPASLAFEATGLGGFAENLLVFGRQVGPCLFRHDKHFRAHRVVGQRIESGEFVVIGGDEGGPVVLRAIDQLGGEPGQYLSIGQFDRLRA